MVQPATWKVIGEFLKTGWILVGLLIGVFVGAWLARSWDRKKWMNDNRKQEYRELLTALTNGATAVIERYSPKISPLTKDEMEAATNRYMDAMKTIKDRIFIAEDMDRMAIFDRWAKAVKTAQDARDIKKFESIFETIRKEIVSAATKY